MADDACTVWFNPSCSKCRSVKALLEERGVDARTYEYLEAAPTRADLERVLQLLGTSDPRAIVRKSEPLYEQLALDGADKEALLDALVAHPILVERPIVILGERAVVARPPERVLEILASR